MNSLYFNLKKYSQQWIQEPTNLNGRKYRNPYLHALLIEYKLQKIKHRNKMLYNIKRHI